MAEPSQKQNGISRRTVVKGAAWAAPVVAVASAAPHIAASTPPPPSHSGLSGWVTFDGTCSQQGGQKIEINSVKPANPTPGITYGLIAAPTKVGDTIEDVYIIWWFTVPNLTWTAGSGSSADWTTPVSTGTTKVVSGTTLYGYKNEYTGSVVAKANQTRVADLHFIGTVSVNQCAARVGGLGERNATINGTNYNYDNGLNWDYRKLS